MYNDELRKLGESAKSHICTNNAFLDRWEKARIDNEYLQLFARNFYTWIKEFPNSVALIMRSTDTPTAKIELLKVIDDELGNGNPNNAHYLIYDRMMTELGTKLGIGLSQKSLSGVPVLRTTKQLVNGQKELLGNKNEYIALGAMMGVEWQAYAMQGRMYEGFRNYKELWSSQREFHNVASFFYIHLGSAELEHEEESLEAAIAQVKNKKDLDSIVFGFNKSLDLLADFWNGLEDYRKRV